MAATRSLGLSKLNVSKYDIEQDKELFSRTVNGGVARGFEGTLAIDSMSQTAKKVATKPLAEPNSEQAIEAALHRKVISENYHTAVPKFLRSQGPFAVYDHSAHKGPAAHEMNGAVNEQALNRFNAEIEGVQRQRERE